MAAKPRGLNSLYTLLYLFTKGNHVWNHRYGAIEIVYPVVAVTLSCFLQECEGRLMKWRRGSCYCQKPVTITCYDIFLYIFL